MIYLVRHAEPTPDETALSAIGMEQASRLGHRLIGRGIRAVEHAPAARATQTATVIADVLGVPATVSELLRDRTPVAAEGEDYPDWFESWAEQVPADERDPGGAALQRAVAHYAGRDGLVLVTHAFVLGWFVRETLDAPAPAWLRVTSAYAGLTVLDRGRLVAVNDTGHLEDRAAEPEPATG